jgi:hypothetical protein
MPQISVGVCESAAKRESVKCKHCSGETEVHLIDCRAPFNTPERAARYCYGCRPEAMDPGQRKFVVDLLDSYPIAERLKDLGRVNG